MVWTQYITQTWNEGRSLYLRKCMEQWHVAGQTVSVWGKGGYLRGHLRVPVETQPKLKDWRLIDLIWKWFVL